MAAARPPLLAVLTGRPGSGKTSLGSLLAPALRLPLLSRDRIKEGLVRTLGAGALTDGEANLRATDAFFRTVGALLESQVSLIAEAAFQNSVWAQRLALFRDRADIRIVICQTSPDRAWERVLSRAQQDPAFAEFHPLPESDRGAEESYNPPRFDAPTLLVDTTNEYTPTLKEIMAFLS